MIKTINYNIDEIFKRIEFNKHQIEQVILLLKIYKPFLEQEETEICNRLMERISISKRSALEGNIVLTFYKEEYNIFDRALEFYSECQKEKFTYILPIIAVEKNMNLVIKYKQYRTLIKALKNYYNILYSRKPKTAIEHIRINVELEKIQKALDNINGVFRGDISKKICRNNLITGVIALNFMIDMGNDDVEVVKFCSYLENLIGYKYNVACEKCQLTKEKDNMGLGLSGMEQLARR